MPASKVIAI